MKQFSTILLLISFIGLAVFGFLAGGHDADGVHRGCLASQARGFACPPAKGTLALANFHIGAFKIFSTAVVALLLVSLSVFLIFKLRFNQRAQLTYFSRPLVRNFFELFALIPQREFLRWMRRHEKRDPVFDLLAISI